MEINGTQLRDLFGKIGFSSKYKPIGVDIGDDTLKLVQLEDNGKGVHLIAGGSENRPADIKPNSGNWQRWAIEAIKRLTENGKFRGKNVIAAMPASEVFIEHLRMPKIKEKEDAMDVILSKIKHKLPIEPDKIIAKYIPTEEDNVLVIATEREESTGTWQYMKKPTWRLNLSVSGQRHLQTAIRNFSAGAKPILKQL